MLDGRLPLNAQEIPLNGMRTLSYKTLVDVHGKCTHRPVSVEVPGMHDAPANVQ